MKNNIIIINGSHDETIRTIGKNEYDIIDFSEYDSNIKLYFEIKNNENININFASLNINKFKKNIKIEIKFIGNNSSVKVQANTLTTNNSSTIIKVNGIMNNNSLINNKIDIKIKGIIDGINSKITGIPLFNFSSNNIIANHALTIGKINPDEWNYLLSRGIDILSAKIILVWSMFSICLKNENNDKINLYKKLLLEKWGNKNG